MNLLEYEAKKILQQYRLPIPLSVLVNSPNNTPSLPVVLKSQVPVGGRGKAGGIRVVSDVEELKPAIEQMLKLSIKGFVPTKLLAEEVLEIDRELYLSILINRERATIELMAHARGGVEVESNRQDSYLTMVVGSGYKVDGGWAEAAGEKLAEYYNLPDKTFVLQDLVEHLYDCFVKNDATLIEINPLVLTKQGKLVAGDCKMELDDAAAFRHPDWAFEETIADATFVTLDPKGIVATIANGAGLGMATVDAVADAGLAPANFLDIGGGATSESVLAAFRKIMEYPNVKVIVINIFAGITKCDEVARAIITAREQISSLPPLSIRLAGTNFEQAVALLTEQEIGTFETLEECLVAAKEIVYG